MDKVLLRDGQDHASVESKRINALVVEGDDEFAASLLGLFHEKQPSFDVSLVKNVKALLSLLSVRADYDWHLIPDVIAIDLDIVGLDGFEFLARIENHPKFHTIPLIVFTKFCANRCRIVEKGHHSSLCASKPSEAFKYVKMVSDKIFNPKDV